MKRSENPRDESKTLDFRCSCPFVRILEREREGGRGVYIGFFCDSWSVIGGSASCTVFRHGTCPFWSVERDSDFCYVVREREWAWEGNDENTPPNKPRDGRSTLRVSGGLLLLGAGAVRMSNPPKKKLQGGRVGPTVASQLGPDLGLCFTMSA